MEISSLERNIEVGNVNRKTMETKTSSEIVGKVMEDDKIHQVVCKKDVDSNSVLLQLLQEMHRTFSFIKIQV